MDKKLIRHLFILVLLIPFFVSAQSVNQNDSAVYINDNNVTIPVDTYNNLRKIYSEEFLSVMSQDKYNELMAKNIDFSSIQKTIKYFKTDYNFVTGEVRNTEVTEEEYNNVSDMTIIQRGTYIETTYKKVALSAMSSGSSAGLILSCVWKIIPATRSFDVMGFRFEGSSVINGSQGGFQIYKLNGSTSTISYAWNGTNINRFSNGFGISMNLVNSNITYLENDIEADIAKSSSYNNIFATYQHATNDISLATSKNYTISAGGLGNVLYFNGSAGGNFDAMQGLYTSI